MILNKQEHKTVTEKGAILILITLHNKKRLSYKKITQKSQVPTSTLSRRLNELTKYKFLEKFVYGSIRKPHNTDYKITKLGLDYLNNICSNIF